MTPKPAPTRRKAKRGPDWCQHCRMDHPTLRPAKPTEPPIPVPDDYEQEKRAFQRAEPIPATCAKCGYAPCLCRRSTPTLPTLSIPRALLDATIEALDKAEKEVTTKEYIAGCVDDGISADLRRLWAVRDSLRSVLTSLRKLRSGEGECYGCSVKACPNPEHPGYLR